MLSPVRTSVDRQSPHDIHHAFFTSPRLKTVNQDIVYTESADPPVETKESDALPLISPKCLRSNEVPWGLRLRASGAQEP